MPEQLKRLTWFKSRFAWRQVFNELSDSELRLLIESIWNYAEEGTEPAELPSTLRIVWVMIRAELTQDIADRQNGKKGGNPALIKNPGLTGVEPGLNRGSIEKNKNREEKEIEKKKSNSGRKQSFVPPSVDEVKAYAAIIGKQIDADYFCDYYTARGWTTGKGEGRKMKDWKAAVRMWTASEEKKTEGGENNAGFNAGRI